jgi:hypothetical protein
MVSLGGRALVALVLLGVVTICTPASGTGYGVVMDGFWSDPATWTPVGGPPTTGDDAYIGLGLPVPAISPASVTLDTAPVVGSVSITNGTLDLNGQTLTAGALHLNTSNAVVNKAGGAVQLVQLDVQSGSTFAIDAADSLTGNVVVAGPGSELDFNKVLALTGASVSIYSGGTLDANDDLAVTDGLIEVNSGGVLNAGGGLSAATVKLNQGIVHLNGQILVCNTFTLDHNSSMVDKSGGNVQARNINLTNGADFAIDADDNVISAVYVNGVGSALDVNKPLSLTGDITVGGEGVVNSYNDLSASSTGVYLGSQLLLHGNSFTVNSLTLENSGTIDKGGGNVQLGSIRLYNAAIFTIDAADSLTGSVTVEDVGSSLAINKNVTLAGPVFVFNGGELTTAGTVDVGGTWGLQIHAGTFNAGGDVDVTASPNAVGIAQGGTLKLNGHSLTAHQLSLGYSPYFGGDTPATIERGTGGMVYLDSIVVRKGSTFSIETGDTLSGAVAVDGTGSSLAINRDLTLADRATVAGGGLLTTAGTLEFSGFFGLQVFNGMADLGGDVSATAGAVGVANGGTIELNGHTINTSQLHLGSTTVFGGNSPGTLNRGVGGSVEVGSIFVYAGSTFSIEGTDVISDYISVDGAGSQLDLNKVVSLSGGVSITNGGKLNANDDFTATDLLIQSGGQMTTAGALEANGFYGLQISNASFDAGGDVDASLGSYGLGIANGATFNLNGHTLTAKQLDLGTSPNFGGTIAGTLNRGSGGSVHLSSINVANGSTFSIEAADSLTHSITVSGTGSALDVNAPLSLAGNVSIANGGTVSVIQSTGLSTGVSFDFDGSVLTVDATSQLELTFDAVNSADDWVLRWAGNHAAEISALHDTGQLTWNFPSNVEVTDLGDGYTYVLFLPTAAGDFNGDGVVDAADYTRWRDTLGSTTSLAADGNHNGVVDERDYEIWKTTFGEMSPVEDGAGAAAVPEPASAMLLALGAIVTLHRTRFARRVTLHLQTA